jgi:hypothetical protein
MKRAVSCLAAVMAAGLLAGCSLEGTWKTVKVEPESAAASFRFASVDFTEDGAFTGTVRYDGREESVKGTYEWDGRTLTVVPEQGETRTYKGTLWWGKKLVLKSDYKGTPVKGTMEKQSAP